METPGPKHRQEQPDGAESFAPAFEPGELDERAPRHRAEVASEPMPDKATRVEDARAAVMEVFETPQPVTAIPEKAPEHQPIDPNTDPTIRGHIQELKGRLMRTAQIATMIRGDGRGYLGNDDEARRMRHDIDTVAEDMARLKRHYHDVDMPALVETVQILHNVNVRPSTRLADLNYELSRAVRRIAN